MAHLKRYRIPKFWPLEKKKGKWAVKPLPGPHPAGKCIPLVVALRDVLKYAESAKEAREILNSGQIIVDKKVRKNPRYPLGMMDVLEIPGAGKYYRVTVDKKGLALQEIEKKKAPKKLCRLEGKTTLKGGITQLNLHDGRNIRLKKTENASKYNCYDSLLIDLPHQKILEHYPLKKGQEAFITGGKNIGVRGKIKEIRERDTMLKESAVFVQSGGRTIKTIKKYIMAGPADLSGVKAEAEPKKTEKPEKQKRKKQKKAKKKTKKKKPKEEKKPTMDWLKKDLKKYAQEQDVDIKSSDTKKDILKKIRKEG